AESPACAIRPGSIRKRSALACRYSRARIVCRGGGGVVVFGGERVAGRGDDVAVARDELEVAGELVFGAAAEAAAVHPHEERDGAACRRRAEDVEEHVRLVAVALVEQRDQISGCVLVERLGGLGATGGEH